MPLPTLDETKTVEQGRSDAPPATLKKCRSAGTLQEVAQHVDRRRSRLPDAPHPPDAYPARTSRAVLYFLDSTPSALPLDGQKRDRLLRT